MRYHYIPSRPPSLGNPPPRLWGMAGCRCRISLRQSITSRIVAFGKGETMPRKAMPDLDPEKLSSYLESVSGTPLRILSLTPLGESVATCAVKGYGYGVPVMVEYEVSGERRKAVLETTSPGAFGHEHMSDRAQMLLWDHEAYNHLPLHARSLDVGGAPREKGPAPWLYVRRIRELVGHGECIMGILDSYPTHHGFITPVLLEGIERRCVAWRWRIKGRTHRLRQVHGDFHPYNILFGDGTRFRVLDRSRGGWGERADDVTSLTGNYLFCSLQQSGRLGGSFETLFRRFWDRYLEKTGDREMLAVAAPFYAFRGLVMASPLWYPTLDEGVRGKP